MIFHNSTVRPNLSVSCGKQYIIRSFALAFCLALVSCGNLTRKKEIDFLMAERDSLLTITHEQDSTKAILDSYIKIIANALDSIKVQGQILTLKVDENGRPLKKSEIMENLGLLSDVIQRQRERIQELESMLLSQGVDSTSYYRSLILHLYDELDDKNLQINDLQKELNRKSAEVNRLNRRVDKLEKDVVDISEQARLQAELIEQQNEIMEAQNQMLNVGYLKIGTKKELQSMGIIKGNLFSSKINPAGVEKNLLDEIDIREFREITLSSKKAKILTTHPQSSYSIEREGELTILTINNPGLFWSTSNYLIILL